MTRKANDVLEAEYEPKSFRRNILFNAGGTAIGSLAQLGLIVVLSRVLKSDDYAGILTAFALVAIGDMASDFGTRIWAMRQFAIAGIPRDTFFVGVLCKCLFSAISAVVILVIGPRVLLISFNDIVLCALIAFTQPATDPALWYFLGKERLDVEALYVVVYRVTYASVLGVLAFLGVPLTGLLLLWLAINLVRIVMELSRRDLRFVFAGAKRTIAWYWWEAWRMLPTVVPLGVAFLLVTLYQRLGVLSLNVMRDPQQVALFGTAFSLVGAAGFVAVSITTATFPALSRAVRAGDMVAAGSLVSKKFGLITLFFVPFACVGIFLSPLVVAVLYGPHYEEAGFVMVLLMPSLYISSVNFGAKYTLNALNLNWYDVLCTIVSVGVFLALFSISLPAPMAKSQQAAIGWGGGECAGLLLRSGFLRWKAGMAVPRLWLFITLFVVLAILVFVFRDTGIWLRELTFTRIPILMRH